MSFSNILNRNYNNIFQRADNFNSQNLREPLTPAINFRWGSYLVSMGGYMLVGGLTSYYLYHSLGSFILGAIFGDIVVMVTEKFTNNWIINVVGAGLGGYGSSLFLTSMQ
jgi:hypothetical protein